MEMIHIITGPLVGAVIGYCTNYIAVKMLFKPLHPVYLFGKQLPFTPGVIPKNKTRIAGALGKAISNSLFTEKDLGEAFLKPETKARVADKIYQVISDEYFRKASVEDLAVQYAGPERTEEMKKSVSSFVAEKIGDAVSSFDIENMLSTMGVQMIMNKVRGTMLAMFMTKDMIRSFIKPVAGNIQEYLDGPGREKIQALASVEVDKLCQTSIEDILKPDEREEMIKEAAEQIYEKCIEKFVAAVIDELDIAGMVEKKVEDMDVGFLEELILSIMKTELDYVVKLGAVIGFVIGCINIFI